MPPFFSIIVPTYNRPRQLARCLESMCLLDCPRDRFEVIVIDDGSDRACDDVVRDFRCHVNVRLIAQTHGGPAAARNTGAAAALGQYLAFTGDDCTPARNWLRALASRLEHQPGCALGGSITNALSGNACAAATHLLICYLYTYYNGRPGGARFFTPNNLTVPADRFSSIGGFDPSFDFGAGEDRDFCDRWLRRGYHMAYVEDAVVSHYHPLTFREFLQLHSNYGRGSRRYRAMLARRNRRSVRLEPLQFYLNLARYTLVQANGKPRLRVALLMGISQVANAVGYFSEPFDLGQTRRPLRQRDYSSRGKNSAKCLSDE
jgi:glycosyltransferase involved in cell wall biosynthesis